MLVLIWVKLNVWSQNSARPMATKSKPHFHPPICYLYTYTKLYASDCSFDDGGRSQALQNWDQSVMEASFGCGRDIIDKSNKIQVEENKNSLQCMDVVQNCVTFGRH